MCHSFNVYKSINFIPTLPPLPPFHSYRRILSLIFCNLMTLPTAPIYPSNAVPAKRNRNHSRSVSIPTSTPALNHHTTPTYLHHHKRGSVHDIDSFAPTHRRRSSTVNSQSSQTSITSGTFLERSGSGADLYIQGYHDKYVLVTGGAGYIGSHTVLELLHSGWRVVILDNLCNSSEESYRRICQLAGPTLSTKLAFERGDVSSAETLDRVFTTYPIWSIIHFAAYKAVGESNVKPLIYYRNNISGSLELLRACTRHQCYNFVFSSSATVYGDPEVCPVNEKARLGPVTNPYGKTKLFVEEALRDLYHSQPTKWNIIILRYFNPVGAHPSGLIGEHPNGIPNNLLPYVVQVLRGQLPRLRVFGNNYDTVDGTGVRDYIHVCDLASGHVAALHKLTHTAATGGGCVAYNLGTGVGYSVLQIVHAMEDVTGRRIEYELVPPRKGDVAACTADATLAMRELGWAPRRNLVDMCEDMWRWTRRCPKGYEGEIEWEEGEEGSERIEKIVEGLDRIGVVA